MFFPRKTPLPKSLLGLAWQCLVWTSIASLGQIGCLVLIIICSFVCFSCCVVYVYCFKMCLGRIGLLGLRMDRAGNRLLALLSISSICLFVMNSSCVLLTGIMHYWSSCQPAAPNHDKNKINTTMSILQ